MNKTDGDSDSSATLVPDTEPSKPKAGKLKSSKLEAGKLEAGKLNASKPEDSELEARKKAKKKLKKSRQREVRWQEVRGLKASKLGIVELSLVLPPLENGNCHCHSEALDQPHFSTYCNMCKYRAITPCEMCKLVAYCGEDCSKQPPRPEFMFPWLRVSR